MTTATPLPTPAPAIALDPARLLGFQPLAAEAETNPDWSAALADLHNKIGDGGEVPGPP
jgi:hypothetical protein